MIFAARFISLALTAWLSVAFSATVADGIPPTYAKDIAPIFQAKCQDCHHSGGSGPMSLVNYNEVRPWAKSIKARVASRSMPPWFIDEHVGVQNFKDNWSLSNDQVATILKWVDSGAPAGDQNDMPPARHFDPIDSWSLEKRFGKPDLIIDSAPYTMAAKGQDQWWQPTGDINIPQARWVRAMELHPTKAGMRITHHAIAHVVPPGSLGGRTLAESDVLFSYGMGKMYDIFEKDTGRLIQPGSKVWWDIHYRAGGEEITDKIQLAVWFYPQGEVPKHHAVWTGFTANIDGGRGNSLDIPPGTVTESNGNIALRSASCLGSFQPHMHRRGKAMTIEAILPNGDKQVISSVDHYNFNWIMNYTFADDAVPCFPKDTKIHVTSWHDNTIANPSNPDARQWVGWGDRTVDEMAIAFVNVTAISDEEYAAWAVAHKR